MNKNDLKEAFRILKSQKLIDYYYCDIVYKFDNKFYQVWFKTYDWKHKIINFRKDFDWSKIKNTVYENYILN